MNKQERFNSKLQWGIVVIIIKIKMNNIRGFNWNIAVQLWTKSNRDDEWIIYIKLEEDESNGCVT